MIARLWERRPRSLIVAATILSVLAALVVPWPASVSVAQHVRFDLTARQFAFEPATIRVNRGDTVTIHLVSQDAEHGLYLDGYGVNMQAEPGRSSEITFVVDREGSFEFRCSVTCGPLHPFMIGKLSVEPDLSFARALAATLIASVGAVVFFWRS